MHMHKGRGYAAADYPRKVYAWGGEGGLAYFSAASDRVASDTGQNVWGKAHHPQ